MENNSFVIFRLLWPVKSISTYQSISVYPSTRLSICLTISLSGKGKTNPLKLRRHAQTGESQRGARVNCKAKLGHTDLGRCAGTRLRKLQAVVRGYFWCNLDSDFAWVLGER